MAAQNEQKTQVTRYFLVRQTSMQLTLKPEQKHKGGVVTPELQHTIRHHMCITDDPEILAMIDKHIEGKYNYGEIQEFVGVNAKRNLLRAVSALMIEKGTAEVKTGHEETVHHGAKE